ncbi:MAG: cobyrinate a,c-diamide synthase [Chloroflexi bacterium]|nr:cobyrinate a,c-diamide synthase [Chloroflexota bacterium]
MSKVKAIVIAGTTSGVGKTTIACGLMATLRRRGLKVQPFKVGPDYIDPSHHTWVTGELSRNLDTWLLTREAVLELFHRAMVDKDIAIIEGVMGLYDGRTGTSEEGSTAQLAKLLGAPVVLVMDCRKGARSLAAMVGGYRDFDPALHLGGVILNGIGSDGHLGLCREAIKHYTGISVLGHLRRSEDLARPERHLGLVPTVEDTPGQDFLEKLVAQCESSFDIPGILRLSEQAEVPKASPVLFPRTRVDPVVKIGIATDRAFSFYYQDSLDLLEAWGAELVPFSPLVDEGLPEGLSGLYIGGGFPELYAADLANNMQIKREIKLAVDRGMPVYAECGGLMYLCESIRDFQGKRHPMVGTISVSSRIDSPRLSLGYRTVRALNNGPLLRCGETVRGHEFHWSVLENGPVRPSAYDILDGTERKEGFQEKGVLASYVHLHLGSLPTIAPHFVETCRRFTQSCRQGVS